MILALELENLEIASMNFLRFSMRAPFAFLTPFGAKSRY